MSEPRDIVDELRRYAGEITSRHNCMLIDEAADEITRLRASLATAEQESERLRDIFIEITAKATPLQYDKDDPERIIAYSLPCGPIHRAAGRLGYQMFDGEHYLKLALERAEKAESALATAEAAGMERAAKVADAHKGSAERKRMAKGMDLSRIQADALDRILAEEEGENIAATMIAAAIRSAISSVQSPSSVKPEIEGLRKALDEIRTDAFLLGTAINERDPYDELFVRVNDIMRYVNTVLSSKEPTP